MKVKSGIFFFSLLAVHLQFIVRAFNGFNGIFFFVFFFNPLLALNLHPVNSFNSSRAEEKSFECKTSMVPLKAKLQEK